ncbi:MAG: hypothetical protein GTO49_24315 [Anaerolineae bacterium]|nr:hypothetical protein [Anaerolineae bacterium]
MGRRRKFPSWVLGLAGLLMGLLAAASLAAPKVLSLSPSPGAQGVPATAAIRISFSRPMDPSIGGFQSIDESPASCGVTLGGRHACPCSETALAARDQGDCSVGCRRTFKALPAAAGCALLVVLRRRTTPRVPLAVGWSGRSVRSVDRSGYADASDPNPAWGY